MKPLYGIITHNNKVVHVEVYDDDTLNNFKKYFEGCSLKKMQFSEEKHLQESWYLYIEMDHDNTYTFEFYHPECAG